MKLKTPLQTVLLSLLLLTGCIPQENVIINPGQAAFTRNDVTTTTIYRMKNTSISGIKIVVTDLPDDISSFTYEITSSNQVLLPNENIQVVGTGTVREVTITPVADLTGETTITATITNTHSHKTLQARVVLVITEEFLLFPADNGMHGIELYKTDGTPSGTTLVKDINPDGDSNVAELVLIDGIYYFWADDGVHGEELWKSDGTTEGTVMIKDIYPGPESSYPAVFINVNGTLFFSARDATNGSELWKSDGTEAGTVIVKDIVSGADGSWPLPQYAINDTLYFIADDVIHGQELWKTDGTESGTVLITDLIDGANNSFSFLSDFIEMNGELYFSALEDANKGLELFKTDGTEAGTVMVKNINPGGSGRVSEFHVINNTLYFLGDDGINGAELWKSDGTEAGTVMVKNIRISTGSNILSSYRMQDINGILYFACFDGVHGHELCRSDGTEAGTYIVKDINLAGDSIDSRMHFMKVNDELFFSADDGVNGNELWKSDGTTAGTVKLSSIEGNDYDSRPFTLHEHFSWVQPQNFILPNGKLFFGVGTAAYGMEPWISDGTVDGTMQLNDINAGAASGIQEFGGSW